MFQLTISAHAYGDAFFQPAVLAPISVDPKYGALLVFRTGSVLYLLLDGTPEEALGITAAVRVALVVRALVAGAARVARLTARLQHAHQHRVPFAQLSACVARHRTHHSLPQTATNTTTLLVNSDVTRTCNKAFAHCTDTDGGRQRTVRALRRAAHSYPRDLLAGRRPTRESESAPGPRALS